MLLFQWDRFRNLSRIRYFLFQAYRTKQLLKTSGLNACAIGIAMILTSILYVLYEETSFPTELCIVMSPFLILGVTHLISCIVPMIRVKLNPKLQRFQPVAIELMWIICIIPTAIIFLIKFMITEFLMLMPVLKIVNYVFMEREWYYAKLKRKDYLKDN